MKTLAYKGCDRVFKFVVVGAFLFWILFLPLSVMSSLMSVHWALSILGAFSLLYTIQSVVCMFLTKQVDVTETLDYVWSFRYWNVKLFGTTLAFSLLIAAMNWLDANNGNAESKIICLVIFVAAMLPSFKYINLPMKKM